MSARPRLVRSVPFWILVVGSVVVGALGLWLTLDKLGIMTSSILDGTATGVEVYAGQSWAVLGSILIGTGLIGLVFALTLGVASSFLQRQEPVVVLADTLDEDDEMITDDVIVDDVAPESVTAVPQAVAVDDVAPINPVLEATTDEQASTNKS